MRIMYVPHASWVTPQRARLFSEMLARRHDVHVTDWVADFRLPADFATRRYWANYVPRSWKERGVTVHHVPRITPALPSTLLRQINYALYARQVRRLIRRFRIECVIGTYVVLPPRAPRLVFDLFDNNPAYWREVVSHPNYADEIERIERRYFAEADAVIAVSSVLRDRALAESPASRRNSITLLPNAVHVDRFRLANGAAVRDRLGLAGKTVVGMVGVLGRSCGLVRLVEAVASLRRPNVTLLVVGYGDQVQPARVRARELGLASAIFTGRVPSEEVPEYCRVMDVAVAPYDKNGFTDAACLIKILEYAASERRVVATHLEELGRLAFPNTTLVQADAQSLAAGIAQALEDPWHGASDFIRTYDAPHVVARLETVLKA